MFQFDAILNVNGLVPKITTLVDIFLERNHRKLNVLLLKVLTGLSDKYDYLKCSISEGKRQQNIS